MQTSRTLRWLLPAALAAVLAIVVTDAVMLRRKPAPVPATQAVPERIGLHAETDGDALQLQWDRRSRPIRNADHAIVFIEDGKYQSQLDLTDQQLNNATVRYWPESPAVTFRMQVYHGTSSTSDSVHVPLSVQSHTPAARVARCSVVERVNRPSPFVRVRPEMVRRSLPRGAPVVPVASTTETRGQHADAQPKAFGLSRVVSKIPLLRRLKRHPQSADSERP